MASNSLVADEAIRTVLRKTAHLHFSKQSEERKREVRKGFYQLDESQDGKISLAEFLQSTNPIIRDGSGAIISKIFNFVDEDKSGFLEFDEYIVFTFIMEAGFQMCDACLSPVIIAGYTCLTCFEQYRSGHGPATDSFDLCACCFASDSFSHPPQHDLVPTALMYHRLLTTASSPQPPPQDSTSEELNEVQCCICDEYHVRGLESALVAKEDHVTMLPNASPPQFVCEWCATNMCVMCGKFFNHAFATNLTPMQWLREDLCCSHCDGEGTYSIVHDKILKIFENKEPFQKCPSCIKKFEDETLIIQDNQSSRFTDPITAAMANNLLLQQSYFQAKMMADFGRAMANLV